MFAAVSLQQASAQPITLTTSPYTNTFDTLQADQGPPVGWFTYTAATATAPGNLATWASVNYSASSNTWRTTSGRFANQASTFSYVGGTNFLGTETNAIQQAEPNRCLADRQVSATDVGVAFVFKIVDTLNRKDFVMTLDSLNLDPTSTRTATWTVDYGFGSVPTLFVPVTNFANAAGTFSTTHRTFNFPNGTIDNNAGPVWIRIAVLSPTSGSGNRQTSGIDNVGLTWNAGVACTPVSINANPAPVAGYINGNATFNVGALGTEPRSYVWLKNSSTVLSDDGHFGGTATPTLTITTLLTSDAGTYSCMVSNVCNGTLYSQTSAGAALTVGTPPTETIAYLRSLVDPVSFAPTNTSLLYKVTGIITTYTNITTSDTASYYLQDSTGGINLFCTFGSTFRPALGDSVTITGFLSSFGGSLELEANLSNPAQGVTINSSGNALPAAQLIAWDNLYQFGTNSTLNYNTVGSLVLLTNVYFGTNVGLLTTNGNYNLYVTNASGQSARVYLPAALDNDLTNRTIPAFACSVQGPLIASSSGGYQVMPTRWSDIVPCIPPPPASSVTITSIVDNGNGTLNISYTGGSGASFTLLQSATVPTPARNTWVPVGANQPSTPGSFTAVPKAGNTEFFTIRSN
jgi:Immunoglobulin domain